MLEYIQVVANMAYNNACTQREKQALAKQIEEMSPPMRELFLKRQEEFQRQRLDETIRRQKIIAADFKERQEKKKIQEECERYEKESRTAYPYAWMLSDWVDDLAKIVEEHANFNPIPRLTYDEER